MSLATALWQVGYCQWVTFPSYPLFLNGIAGTLLSLVISMVFAISPEHMFSFPKGLAALRAASRSPYAPWKEPRIMLAWIRALFNEIRPCGASAKLRRSMKWASPMKCWRMTANSISHSAQPNISHRAQRDNSFFTIGLELTRQKNNTGDICWWKAYNYISAIFERICRYELTAKIVNF